MLARQDMHVHSSFSDGKNTPEEIIKAAIQLKLSDVCIVDHVRQDSDWLDDFFKTMKSLKNLYLWII